MGEGELLKDKEQWLRFCSSISDRAGQLDIRAVMAAPYGEALVHPWYWEGLGLLAAMETMDQVGAQTNLSFSVEESLKLYEGAGGKRGKLKLWATFHPEMVTAEAFAGRCMELLKAGATVSAGAVGAVENLEPIRSLRRKLPDEIYLWINKMDGLGRDYSEEERAAFESIDPYFGRELVPAEPGACGQRLFVEGDGKLRRCNISRVLAGNWYDPDTWETVFKEADGGVQDGLFRCGKKNCSCYLAYGGRNEVMNRVMFGPYPLFRIPERPKAVFLDIDGTLVPKGKEYIPKRFITDIQILAAQGCRMFFATSLPYSSARKKCGEVWHLFRGGVFAGGGHVVLELEGEKRERFFPVEKTWLPVLERMKGKYHFRILPYGGGDCGGLYKITLLRPRHMAWKEDEAEALMEECRKEGGCGKVIPWDKIRCFAEGRCLQIVHAQASKGEGVKQICRWLKISAKEAAAAGDSSEDKGMLELCSPPGGAAVPMDTADTAAGCASHGVGAVCI